MSLQANVLCTCAYVCVCGRLPKVKWCKDPAWLCVCVCLICLRWDGLGLGGVVVVVCRPLTSRTTGSIRQSWIHRRGRGGLGGGREGNGVQSSQRKRRKTNEKSDEMCLIFWWR